MDEKIDIDILSIDAKITAHFDGEILKVVNYKSRLKELNNIIGGIKDKNVIDKIHEDTQMYINKISEIENNKDYTFYMLEAIPVLEKYRKVLKTPVKFFFSGAMHKTLPDDAAKETIINEYLQIAIKYITNFEGFNDFDISIFHKDPRPACEMCRSKRIVTDQLFIICEDCGYEKESYQKHIQSEIVRPLNQKYIEERKAHFRDCMNQFQGKQNGKVDDKVYKDLENEFVKRNMLSGDSNTPKEKRYANVKFDHIMMFLKELGLDKQYDNAKYIYTVLTGTKCHDLSKIEDQILNDFDVLINLYIKKYKYEGKLERKSFLSIQYLLMAILKKNKFPCETEDFINILKTNDRKAFHDDITKVLFAELSWNFTPLF